MSVCFGAHISTSKGIVNAINYCKNTNFVYIDKARGKKIKYWTDLIQIINRKNSFLLDFNDESYFNKLTNFISENHKI